MGFKSLFILVNLFTSVYGMNCVELTDDSPGEEEKYVDPSCDLFGWKYYSSTVKAVYSLLAVGTIAEHDYCEVYEGSDMSGRLLGVHLGDPSTVGPIVSYDSTEIYHYCKLSDTTSTIRIDVVPFNPSFCGTTYIESLPKKVTSPLHPGNYDQNTLCVWKFVGKQLTTFSFTFTTFDVEHNFDYVYVNSYDVSSPSLMESGRRKPFQFKTTGKSFRMVLISDPEVTRPGFSVDISTGAEQSTEDIRNFFVADT